MVKKLHACLAATLLALATAAVAQTGAANYPNQPIKLMVPWPPGGGVDTTARMISEPLSQRLGQPIVIDNRGGAGGNIGTEMAARTKPDGYNLLMGSISPNAVNIHLYARLGFDPIKDFAPIVYVSSVPNILVVPASSPAKTRQGPDRRWRAPIRASSTTARAASARRSTWRRCSSWPRPRSTSCTCRTRAPRRPRPTWSPATSR